jgi:hypothetical protein
LVAGMGYVLVVKITSMKITIHILISFLCCLGNAQVRFTPTQQILMQGSSCQELADFGQSILDWSLSINKQTSIRQPECFCSTEKCQMDVSGISPNFVMQLTNFDPVQMESAHNGPNCFNAALYASQTLPSVSFTHPYEMTAILSSSLCRERRDDENLQPGDILVVRDQNNPLFEIHAGVYINQELSFSKYGENKMMPYSYGTDVHRSYGVHDENCARVQGIPAVGEACYHKPFVNFYSCKAMYTFVSQLAKRPGGINEAVRAIYAEVYSYDNKISRIAFKGHSIPSEDLQKLISSLQTVYEKTLTVSSDVNLNQENREFLKLIHFHVFSLYEQARRIAIGMGKIELAKPPLSNPSL